jgi:Flp pilus assembly protein TadG
MDGLSLGTTGNMVMLVIVLLVILGVVFALFAVGQGYWEAFSMRMGW